MYDTRSCRQIVGLLDLTGTRLFLSLQSSKCRSVFASTQKLDGFKRLDRQLAQFNDYNFVFTSYAKNCQQNPKS